MSHYSAEEDKAGLINILTVNRNSAIVIDSDKRHRGDRINETKKRIAGEFEERHLFAWITQGKEIENYVHYSAINRAYGANLQTQCGQYEIFPEYIKDVRKNFENEKVPFANKVKDYINCTEVLDLDVRIKELCKTIKSWNK